MRVAYDCRRAMMRYVEAAFAEERDEYVISTTINDVMAEYEKLPFYGRWYVDFIWWRTMRLMRRILRKHGIAVPTEP